MFALDENVTYLLYAYPVNMCKGIRALSNLILVETDFSPQSGTAYIFFSRDRKQVKILRWDTDGFILYQKRLVRGSFHLPDYWNEAKGCFEMSFDAFYMIMRGVNFTSMSYDKRFNLRTSSGVNL